MLSLTARGLNVAYLFAIAAAVSWALAFLSVVPAEAGYQLIEDRCSGALELLLCTPMDERRIVKGVWLDLRRRYLGPLLATALAIGNGGLGSFLALLAVFVCSAVVRSRHARAVLLADMRQAAADRYSPQP